MHPPDPDIRKAGTRQSADPVSQSNSCTADNTETIRDRQTQSLCHRYALGYYFAAVVAQLAWVAR